MTEKRSILPFPPSALRDPMYVFLTDSPETRAAFFCYRHTCMECLQRGVESGSPITLVSRASGFSADELLETVARIKDAADAARREPWMTRRSGDTLAWEWFGDAYTAKGGTREGAGRPSNNQREIKGKSKGTLNTVSVLVSDSSPLPEGESEGKPPDLPASYAGSVPDHPFNRAWLAWPDKAAVGTARIAWDAAIARLRRTRDGPHGEWLAGRVEAYAASTESKRNMGTKFHPRLASWLDGERYDDDESAWSTNDGQSGARTERESGRAAPKQPRRVARR